MAFRAACPHGNAPYSSIQKILLDLTAVARPPSPINSRGRRMRDRELCAHRIERWDDDKKNFGQRLACVDDFLLASATYSAACRQWPDDRIRWRWGRRIIEDSRQQRATDADAAVLPPDLTQAQ